MKADEPLLLIGNGTVDAGALALVQPFARRVVAADGGADVAAALGVRVDVIIGDMDSVSAESLGKEGVQILRVSEQDTTDFEKCLQNVEAPLVLGLGFLGGRLDHELAALNALVKHAKTNVLLIGERDLVFLCPKRLELALPKGTRVSLFPMGRAIGLRSDGLEYGLDGLVLAPDAGIGTSNRASAGRQVIEVADGPILVILSRRHISAAIDALELASKDT